MTTATSTKTTATGITVIMATLALMIGAGAVYGYQRYSKKQNENITGLSIMTPKGITHIGIVSNDE